MRGKVERQASMLTLVGPDQRVPKDLPIRRIKLLTDRELERLSSVFESRSSVSEASARSASASITT
ncbi:hypothetical protein [Vulgatibacter incomptus]|nr:hypothetical protein [Vulgatibacter incomptus]